MSPLVNRPPCDRCHDPNHRDNDVILVDLNVGQMRAAMNRDLRWLTAGSGALMLVLLAAVGGLFRLVMGGELEHLGFRVVAVGSGAEAVARVSTLELAVVILDPHLPDVDGLQALRSLRETSPGSTVIMLSGDGSVDTAVESVRMGAFDFVTKPCLPAGRARAPHREGAGTQGRPTRGEPPRAAADPLSPPTNPRGAGAGAHRASSSRDRRSPGRGGQDPGHQDRNLYRKLGDNRLRS